LIASTEKEGREEKEGRRKEEDEERKQTKEMFDQNPYLCLRFLGMELGWRGRAGSCA
jgi:hypothetical protein